MSFGEKLRAWRKAKGLTQEELASAAGIKPAHMSNLERNFSTSKTLNPKPSEALVDRFAKVLEIPLDEMRLAAGYAPIKKILPSQLNVMGFDGLDPNDLEEIAEFINFKRAKKGLPPLKTNE